MLGDPEAEKARCVVINPRTGTFLGVTVSNTASREGVMVTSTDTRDLVHASGIRAGVVITHINAVPVNDHQTAVLLLESATTSETRVHLRTRRSPLASIAWEIRKAVSRRFRVQVGG